MEKQISNWRDFLKESEIAELLMISRLKQAGQMQTRRIYDRCRKRMKKAEGKARNDQHSI